MSVRSRANRASRAPRYSMLSSLLSSREVKFSSPGTEKCLVVLSFASGRGRRWSRGTLKHTVYRVIGRETNRWCVTVVCALDDKVGRKG